MILQSVWNFLEKDVFNVPSTNILFNQYKDINLAFDKKLANKIRRENLENYLLSFKRHPTNLILGEAPGPHGCRFSGVGFTSEMQLCKGLLHFKGCQSSNSKEPRHEALSANIFWETLLKFHQDIFVWNSIPFHPHIKDEIFKIRNPTTKEIKTYLWILDELISILKPARIVAIGRKPEEALKRLNIDCIYVRHPSRGGKKEFTKGMSKVFH